LRPNVKLFFSLTTVQLDNVAIVEGTSAAVWDASSSIIMQIAYTRSNQRKLDLLEVVSFILKSSHIFKSRSKNETPSPNSHRELLNTPSWKTINSIFDLIFKMLVLNTFKGILINKGFQSRFQSNCIYFIIIYQVNFSIFTYIAFLWTCYRYYIIH